ncbi:MAG: right-handed parallel beta-helix repeat-containing protein [Clostridia bacterium]|nr:right-handed parallel beta-helix repeat-containing protein [Clostridia bacterium]
MITFKQTGEKFTDIYSAREAVLRFARAADGKARQKAELVFDQGKYKLSKSVVFSAKESPELSKISLALSCEEGRAAFTSEKVLLPDDFKKEGEYYTYRFKKDADGKYPRLRDLYVNGKCIPMCKGDMFAYEFEIPLDGSDVPKGFYIPEDAVSFLSGADSAPLELTLYAEWEFMIFPIVRIERNRVRFDENGKKHIFVGTEGSVFDFYLKKLVPYLQPKIRGEMFLCNHPGLLEEGTWCYDGNTGVLCYRGSIGIGTELSVPALDKLFVFEGMDGVALENLEFTGVTDKFVCENGYISGQANMEKRLNHKAEEAAVFARGVSGFSVEKCCFWELGTNALLMVGDLARIYIRNSHFENIAMSAVSIGNPVGIFTDKRSCSFDIRVENNFISHIGYEFPTSPAVNLFRVDGLSVCHNTIEYCAYSGISVGWNWAELDYALGEMVNIRDAKIAYNRICHHMQILRDGGAIYAVGCNCTKKHTEFFNFMHDNFAYRDSVKRTVRGFYLDGASSNWHVYNSVASGAQRPMFSQFVAEGEFTHNILVQNIYVTEGVEPENHAPERNTIYKNIYFAPTIDELLRKYPKAREIYENSGCKDI